MDTKANNGQTALTLASMNDYSEIVEFMMQHRKREIANK